MHPGRPFQIVPARSPEDGSQPCHPRRLRFLASYRLAAKNTLPQTQREAREKPGLNTFGPQRYRESSDCYALQKQLRQARRV